MRKTKTIKLSKKYKEKSTVTVFMYKTEGQKNAHRRETVRSYTSLLFVLYRHLCHSLVPDLLVLPSQLLVTHCHAKACLTRH